MRLPVIERHSKCNAGCELGLSLFQKAKLEWMCLNKQFAQFNLNSSHAAKSQTSVEARCHLSDELTGSLDLFGNATVRQPFPVSTGESKRLHAWLLRWLVSCSSAHLASYLCFALNQRRLSRKLMEPTNKQQKQNPSLLFLPFDFCIGTTRYMMLIIEL